MSTVQALLALFLCRVPDAVRALQGAIREDLKSRAGAWAVTRVYEGLTTVDFSRDILVGQESRLRVQPVPHCGWSDLGTPERVARVLLRSAVRSDGASVVAARHLSLAVQHERAVARP